MKRSNVVLMVAMLLLASGCASQVGFSEAELMEPVGGWHGLWHGMIAPVAWLVSLFNEDVAIYAIYNNGGWYDFGFILGIGALAGGAHRS
jgi:hypothetical protein